ncbi:chemotaxis protein MotB [Rhizobium soli]|uniref:Chemotaxis protein MotB n=1 Tax=Rhizobium soli TaxID=424798 RepID=A0A7X0JI98_9HYPH|nr:MotB family protein [Rhizobium soli]MBB6507720.1 chemotaxis protein MotB [Rhizobium soli]
MSEAENHHHGKNEIIIIKRHRGDHDSHHGGAWKIAFADFMTAMMAFFLVMWLVNAANEETKASLASYFNPVPLSDDTPASKGIKKPSDQAKGEDSDKKSTVENDKTGGGKAGMDGESISASGDDMTFSEAALFQNPYSVLASIAQEVGQQANVSTKGEGGASDSGPSTGADGGEAYRDPFDPDFWSKQLDTPAQAKLASDTSLPGEQASAFSQPPAVETVPVSVKPDAVSAPDASDASVKKAKAELDAAGQDKAEELQKEIQAQVAGIAGKLAEGIVVQPAEGGTLIMISDEANTAMFNVGSALPGKELVLAMEKIGKLLAARPGSVIIRGHTDGRPFKGRTGDNWSLSMSRAHAAYYMLVRGGLNEERVKQVSGFADRRLRNVDDPMSGANRRIEILLGNG